LFFLLHHSLQQHANDEHLRRRVQGMNVDDSDLLRAPIDLLPASGRVTAYKMSHMFGLEHLAGGFRPDAIRLIVAHTHLANAILAGSERKVHGGALTTGAPWSRGHVNQ
jgi:hypothetical protein